MKSVSKVSCRHTVRRGSRRLPWRCGVFLGVLACARPERASAPPECSAPAIELRVTTAALINPDPARATDPLPVVLRVVQLAGEGPLEPLRFHPVALDPEGQLGERARSVAEYVVDPASQLTAQVALADDATAVIVMAVFKDPGSGTGWYIVHERRDPVAGGCESVCWTMRVDGRDITDSVATDGACPAPSVGEGTP